MIFAMIVSICRTHSGSKWNDLYIYIYIFMISAARTEGIGNTCIVYGYFMIFHASSKVGCPKF